MRLKRLGPPPYEPEPIFDWQGFEGDSPDESEAYVLFGRYGQGSENTSSLVAALTWKDVEAVIAVFARMDYPQAVRLEKATRLADAVEALSRISN